MSDFTIRQLPDKTVFNEHLSLHGNKAKLMSGKT